MQLNKTMNNLRLWGYDRSSLRSQMHDTQHSRVLNAGLIDKLNQLKTNIQEVQKEARTSALQIQEAIIEINNKDKAVDALVAHSNTITTNLQQTQQQMETKLKGHLNSFEVLQQNLVEISSSIENIGIAERASAVQAHENIIKNLNLSIKKFQEYKEETLGQHQNLMRRLGELYAERHLHKLQVSLNETLFLVFCSPVWQHWAH